MGVIPDILRSWRDPRGLIAEKAATRREPLALATLMGACALIFVAQWPLNARLAHLDPSVPLDARMGASLMAVVFILPLVMYVLAGVSHMIARALGGRGTGFGARMALFQALLALTPVSLLYGLVRGFVGEGTAAVVLGLIWAVGLLWMWLTMLVTVERG